MTNDFEADLYRLSGDFDGIAARRLEAMLARQQPGGRLRVDLAQVHHFHDFALAVLAQALGRCKAQVTLLGLRLHQIRMLRYFGVDTSSLLPAVMGDAAD